MNNIKIIYDMVKQLLFIMNGKQKKECVKAFIAMSVSACLETLGVSVVIPFILALMEPAKLLENRYVASIAAFFRVSTPSGLMFLMAGGVIIVYLVKNIVILFSSYIQVRFRNRMEKELSVLMLVSYMKRPYTYYLETNSSEILRGVNSDVAGVAQVIDGFFLFLTESLTFLLLSIFLLCMNPVMAIGIVATISICALVIVLGFKGKINVFGKRSREAFADRYQYAYQAVTGIKEITVMQRRNNFVRQYEDASEAACKCNVNYQFTSKLPSKIIEVVFIGSIVLMACMGLRSDNGIEAYIPQLGALAVACVRMLPSVSNITASMNTLVFYRPTLISSCENIQKAADYEKLLKGYADRQKESGDTKRFPTSFRKSLVVDRVRWHYNNSDKYVLDGLSMEINKGDAVALIGESGAGKTTLADSILGLLKPQEGTITMDGVDIFAMPENWAKIIGYVPQTVFLIDDTIRSNVAFGLRGKDSDDQMIWKALEQAQLKKFVEGLPEGLDTIVGERGVKFSGGQRQRVAIARALYYNPDILVLDEATSALDTETETAVMESIDALQGHKTLIIVAHRLTTIRNCNKIFEIKGGAAEQVDKSTLF